MFAELIALANRCKSFGGCAVQPNVRGSKVCMSQFTIHAVNLTRKVQTQH